ncbi:MAG: transcription termination factor Rho, partial [Calditrichaeota bacterium]|nr:transcription termination factor Rho [Calditrichota bacterium]
MELQLETLQSQKDVDLIKQAHDLSIKHVEEMNREDLIYRIMEENAANDGLVYAKGVLQILPDGYGFLRSSEHNYVPSPDDIYVSPSQIKRFGLRKGDTIYGQIRPPKEGERFFALLKVDAVNFEKKKKAKFR